tara:strand:+ start:485 stop:829 length:345 start_codon:yes stop_codon:yes gene_type:complete
MRAWGYNLKNLFITGIGCAIASAIFSPAEGADRTLTLPARNPATNTEANTATWNSINELSGKSQDIIRKALPVDKIFPSRLAIIIYDTWTDHMSSFTSHELAHHARGEQLGENL